MWNNRLQYSITNKIFLNKVKIFHDHIILFELHLSNFSERSWRILTYFHISVLKRVYWETRSSRVDDMTYDFVKQSIKIFDYLPTIPQQSKNWTRPIVRTSSKQLQRGVIYRSGFRSMANAYDGVRSWRLSIKETLSRHRDLPLRVRSLTGCSQILVIATTMT